MKTNTKVALVAGATGLVGRQILSALREHSEVRRVAMVRREGQCDADEELRVDYEDDASLDALPEADIVFCALGTTRKKAGSDQNFVRVDRDYPARLLERAARWSKPPVFALVSSIGADRGTGLYLRTKLELETRVRESGLRYVIARPSILVGERDENRLGERIGLSLLGPPLRALGAVSDWFQRYAPIEARMVARALVAASLGDGDGDGKAGVILEGAALFEAGR